MKKLLIVMAAVLMMVALAEAGNAFEPNVIGYAYYPSGMLGIVTASFETNLDFHASCGVGQEYTGTIAWVDRDQQTMKVEGTDGSKVFQLSESAMDSKPEADQFVSVNYTVTNGDRVACSVTELPKEIAWVRH